MKTETLIGTAGGGGATIFAQVQSQSGQAPWWAAIVCAVLAVLPAIFAFVDRRCVERSEERKAAAQAKRAADVASADTRRAAEAAHAAVQSDAAKALIVAADAAKTATPPHPGPQDAGAP